MSMKRRNHSPQFKSKVALALIKGDQSLNCFIKVLMQDRIPRIQNPTYSRTPYSMLNVATGDERASYLLIDNRGQGALNDVFGIDNISLVPVPATLPLLGLGLVCIL